MTTKSKLNGKVVPTCFWCLEPKQKCKCGKAKQLRHSKSQSKYINPTICPFCNSDFNYCSCYSS